SANTVAEAFAASAAVSILGSSKVTHRSVTSWCYLETHSQYGCVALERLVDQFAGYRFGFAFEQCFSKQGGMVSRLLRSPAWIAALPGSNGRPRCFAAVFSAGSKSSTALPSYMADHYTTRMR